LRRHGIHRCAATLCRYRIKRRGAHRQHLNGFIVLLSGNDVTSINGTHKNIVALDCHHIGQRLHIEQRRHAGQKIFTAAGRWRENRAVLSGKRHYQRGNIFRELMLIVLSIGEQDFANTCAARRCIRYCLARGARD
jgi:hypothetical protein